MPGVGDEEKGAVTNHWSAERAYESAVRTVFILLQQLCVNTTSVHHLAILSSLSRPRGYCMYLHIRTTSSMCGKKT